MSDPATVPIDAADETALQAALGYTFRDRSILHRALAHRSWCAEYGSPVESNERLEFLGDSVLGLVVTDHVYGTFPELPEGHLSEVRASVVNAATLAEVASGLGVGRCLLLGKGEDQAGGREKQSILADALEAIIAAVYLDGGIDDARRVVLDLLAEPIADAAAGPGWRDYKTRLQEIAAQRGIGRPRYVVTDDGPDHEKRFYATVLLAGEARGDGEGRSKKQAEQAAAFVAWTWLTTVAAPGDGSGALDVAPADGRDGEAAAMDAGPIDAAPIEAAEGAHGAGAA